MNAIYVKQKASNSKVFMEILWDFVIIFKGLHCSHILSSIHTIICYMLYYIFEDFSLINVYNLSMFLNIIKTHQETWNYLVLFLSLLKSMFDFKNFHQIDDFLCTVRSLMKLLIWLSREGHGFIRKSCPNGVALMQFHKWLNGAHKAYFSY